MTTEEHTRVLRRIWWLEIIVFCHTFGKTKQSKNDLLKPSHLSALKHLSQTSRSGRREQAHHEPTRSALQVLQEGVGSMRPLVKTRLWVRNVVIIGKKYWFNYVHIHFNLSFGYSILTLLEHYPHSYLRLSYWIFELAKWGRKSAGSLKGGFARWIRLDSVWDSEVTLWLWHQTRKCLPCLSRHCWSVFQVCCHVLQKLQQNEYVQVWICQHIYNHM